MFRFPLLGMTILQISVDVKRALVRALALAIPGDIGGRPRAGFGLDFLPAERVVARQSWKGPSPCTARRDAAHAPTGPGCSHTSRP